MSSLLDKLSSVYVQICSSGEMGGALTGYNKCEFVNTVKTVKRLINWRGWERLLESELHFKYVRWQKSREVQDSGLGFNLSDCALVC
jgi:hypothetical protein